MKISTSKSSPLSFCDLRPCRICSLRLSCDTFDILSSASTASLTDVDGRDRDDDDDPDDDPDGVCVGLTGDFLRVGEVRVGSGTSCLVTVTPDGP